MPKGRGRFREIMGGSVDQIKTRCCNRSLSTSYDQYAVRNNGANPRQFRREAAWVYYKIGALYQRLGRAEESEDAIERSSQILAGLVAGFREVTEYRTKLVDVAMMTDPWSAREASLPDLEIRLRRARMLIEPLTGDVSSAPRLDVARVHVLAKLGVILQRLGQLDEAEANYREAIEIAGQILDQSPDNIRIKVDRVDIREELAMLLVNRGSGGRGDRPNRPGRRRVNRRKHDPRRWPATDRPLSPARRRQPNARPRPAS